MISPETGKALYSWLSTADQAPVEVVKVVTPPQPVQPVVMQAPQVMPQQDMIDPNFGMAVPPPAPVPVPNPADAELANAMAMVDQVIKAYMAPLPPEQKVMVPEQIKAICGKKNYKTVTDINMLRALYAAFAQPVPQQ